MPFVARCKSDGWVARAVTREFLSLVMQGHDIKSGATHDEDNWTVLIISYSDYHAIQRLGKTFFKALRSPSFKLESLISV